MAKKKVMDSSPTADQPSMPKEELLHGQPKYKVESAVRTLQEAQSIKKDPGLHRAAKKHAASQMQDLEDIADGGADEDQEEMSPGAQVKNLGELKRVARKKSGVSA